MFSLSEGLKLPYNDDSYYEFHWKVCHPFFFEFMDNTNKNDDYSELEFRGKSLNVYLSMNKDKTHL